MSDFKTYEDITFFIGLGVVVLIILWTLIEHFVIPPIKAYVFGLKRYEYENTNGRRHYKWYKSDEEALHDLKRWDFVRRIYPDRKRIKPNG